MIFVKTKTGDIIEAVEIIHPVVKNKPGKEELLQAFNSGETVDDGLEEVFRLGQRHFLAK